MGFNLFPQTLNIILIFVKSLTQLEKVELTY